jgi:hypothetical protein
VNDFGPHIERVAKGGIIIDVKSAIDKRMLASSECVTWSL